MPSGFGELTVQAHHLVSAGDLAGAQRLLADALTDADPRPANASPGLAEAAGLQAKVLVALGEPHSARGWAAFAYAAATRLYGRSDERTVTAGATLAAVLHRVGSNARAARLYSDVIIELTARDGPEAMRVLAAHADLATVEYARGQCAVARDRLQDAWELHREVYGEGHPSGIKMLAKLGAMERDCGRYAESQEHLTLAEELCRLHLPADDPLAAQVAALARAPADPDHACADPAPPAREAPVREAPVRDAPVRDTPVRDTPVRDTPVRDTPVRDTPVRETPVVPAARVPPVSEGPPDPPPPFFPEPPLYRPPDRAAEATQRSVPTPRVPAEDGDPFDEAVGDDWWPPEADLDDLYRAGESALPPPVVGLAEGEADGVRRVPRAAEPERPYLPLPVPRPPEAEPRTARWLPPARWLPLAVAGGVVVLLGTAAVIAGVFRVDGPGDARPPSATATGGPATGTPAPTGTPPAAPGASPGTPPGAVRLTDRRDSIALRWTYPAGAEGPVVIAGGRAGQGQHTFVQLPAGTDSYIAYGLSRTTDYCFTVAVVWSTDTVARAQAVCTKRG